MVFLSSWYRHQLGISRPRGSPISLDVETTENPLRSMWWQVRACARHPQIIVVMSTVLAVVGAGLGIVGLAAVLKEIEIESFEVWEAIALLGVVVVFLGFAPLARRSGG